MPKSKAMDLANASIDLHRLLNKYTPLQLDIQKQKLDPISQMKAEYEAKRDMDTSDLTPSQQALHDQMQEHHAQLLQQAIERTNNQQPE